MLCKFPQILSKLRRARGISQKKAAGELGISPALLSHYENGIRECGLDFLISLADYYSVSCDYLLGKSDIKNPNVYEAEPEALVVDRVLKIAKAHSEKAHVLLSDISNIESYAMIRALCDTASRGDAFSFDLETADYKNLCHGVTGELYAKLSMVKERKKLPSMANENTDKAIKSAEKTLKKHLV